MSGVPEHDPALVRTLRERVRAKEQALDEALIALAATQAEALAWRRLLGAAVVAWDLGRIADFERALDQMRDRLGEGPRPVTTLEFLVTREAGGRRWSARCEEAGAAVAAGTLDACMEAGVDAMAAYVLAHPGRYRVLFVLASFDCGREGVGEEGPS